ncbi:MAG: sulfotransferase family 2 domain-containing protein [Rubrivivax sp.]
MIVSHRHRYIFLRTRKTAGTSVEIALSKFCGPDDVITSDVDDGLRRELGYPGPQNDADIPVRRYGVSDWKNLLLHRQRATYRNHATAARVRRLVGEAVWSSYFKFTIERDPWDKTVSLYYWRLRGQEPKPTLPEFVRQSSARALSNARIYFIGGRPAVDRVLRYEKLDEELEQVRLQLALPEPLVLPHAKSTQRTERAHYSALLGPEERRIIERACRREITLLGYRFDDRGAG